MSAQEYIRQYDYEWRLFPFIVVSPTWDIDNQEKEWEDSCDEILQFWNEYVDCLISYIETQYKTYYDKYEVSASRAHRAIGGFSLGGIATWYVFTNECQKYYIPMWGECWSETENEDFNSEQTIDLLSQYVHSIDNEFEINIGIGTRDSRFKYVDKQVQLMNRKPHIFTDGNFKLYVKENGYHAYSSAYEYLYKVIPYVFI